jgi:hypothetical protein
LQDLLSLSPGITKEIVSRGPHVPDMECQEPDDLSIASKGPFFLQVQSTYRQQQCHGPVLKWQWVSLHEVMSPGIMVCFILIFEALEHVLLNPSSFHDVCLEIMLFTSFIP